MNINQLTNYLDTYLRIKEQKDYGPQGLQVEADKEDVQRIALAVDVSPTIIAAAAEWQADMLLVHHGILWRSVERIAGPLGKRVRDLLRHNIHLYAAHLPLDVHPVVGNNAILAQLCGIKSVTWWGDAMGTPIGVAGDLSQPMLLNDLVAHINQRLNTQSVVLAHGPEQVERLAIISGFGADKVWEAKETGADTYLTGETSHAEYWNASDWEMNVIFAGHYATETVGVQALGRHLTEKFGIETRFFDFPTGM